MALLTVFVGLLSLYSVSGCSLPPRLWCSSPQIARACKVEEQCRDGRWPMLGSGEADKVQVTLAYEYKCPYCKIFIIKQLLPVWKDLSSILDIVLVPYGNAYEVKDGDKWKFNCQHGPDECEGNLLETCAIYVLKDVHVYLPLIACMELSSDKSSPDGALQKCGNELEIPTSDITSCAKSDLGNQLEHVMGLMTKALDVSSVGVPFIVVNGMSDKETQDKASDDLKGLVCELYKGKKPAACQT